MRLVDFCRAYAELSSSSFDLRALGHKSIRNTQICINLEQAIFNEGESSEYTTRIARTVKGARALLAAGFEYVTDMEDYKLFRKRKQSLKSLWNDSKVSR